MNWVEHIKCKEVQSLYDRMLPSDQKIWIGFMKKNIAEWQERLMTYFVAGAIIGAMFVTAMVLLLE